MNPKLKADINIQRVGAEVLLLNMSNEELYLLNEMALWIVDRCDGNHSLSQIVMALIDSFEIDQETASRDVKAVLDQLIRAEFIEYVDS